jgi:apolipoprotein N-acyltransferase
MRADWALAAASGLLLTAGFPAIDLPGLAFIALLPLLAATRGSGPARAWRLGFVTGGVHYLTLLYWVVYTMRTYGHLPLYLSVPVLFLLAAYLALYPAFFGAGLVLMRTSPWTLAPAAAFLWTGLELIRAHLFTGFPWALLGYSQFARLELIQVADVAGVYGVSFFIVLVNAGVWTVLAALGTAGWHGQRVSRPTAFGVAALVLAAAAGLTAYGHWRLADVAGRASAAPARTVAVVQGNIDQALKWDPVRQAASVEKYLALSERALAQGPDLVVWPETATPFYLFDNPPLTEMVTEFVARARTPFLVGSPSFRPHGEAVDYFNSAYLIDAAGRSAGRYDKVHLVPFGEYVPLKPLLPFVGKMVAQVGDFKSGIPGATLAWNDRRIGVQICYEIIFPRLSRQMVTGGADILINLTNDAWFGRTGAPYQHFSMVVLRAVENRRTVVRAANTGISAVIGPDGRVDARTDLFEDATFVRSVPLMTEPTVYTRCGDVWAGLCLAVSLVLLGAGMRRRRWQSNGL